MGDLIEPAKTARSRCRGCREKIEKGVLRFGEEVPNMFADEDDAVTLHWFHVVCGADKRPEKFAAALADYEGEMENRAELQAIAQAGMDNPELTRVLRAERSPSGRARCRQCRELIEKDSLRVAIEPEADPNSMATAYFVHAGCAVERVGEAGLLPKLERVSDKLTDEDFVELRSLIAG